MHISSINFTTGYFISFRGCRWGRIAETEKRHLRRLRFVGETGANSRRRAQAGDAVETRKMIILQ